MRCKYCKELTATRLSIQGVYSHQPSLRDLISSADRGCDICQAFLRGFQKKCPGRFGLSDEEITSYNGENDDFQTLGMAGFSDQDSEEPDSHDSTIHPDLNSGKVSLNSHYAGELTHMRAWVNEIKVTVASHGDSPSISVPFDLFVSHDDPYAKDTFIMGRSIVTNRLSNKGINLMKAYLNDCMNGHPQCSLARSTPLPTRLVDVGDTNSRTAPFLFQSRGTLGSYIALSYCWGGFSGHQTTRSNLKQRMKKIDQNTLPRTIRESILVAKALGYRYIWIDSLCIIQDDVNDWENESRRMASIYGKAQITIHAANCSTSDEGFLTTSVKKSYPISWSNRFFKGENARRSPKVFIREQTQDWVSMTRASPLATRSWTLQERMLSKRSLFFGKDQIYWECNACIRCENNLLAVPDIEPRRLHAMSTKHHKESHRLYIQSIDNMFDRCGSYRLGLKRYLSQLKIYHSSLNKARPKPGLVDRIQALNGQRDPDTSYVSPVEQRSMLEEWSAIVEAYSGRQLTKPSDKLPAMAGLMLDLAARYGVDNEEYVAGLWKNDIYELRGLLWRVDASREQIKISRRYRAPSWSWAKLDGQVSTQIGKEHDEMAFFRHGSDRELSCRAAEVLSVKVEGSFMRVKRAHLTIRGYCGYLDRKLFDGVTGQRLFQTKNPYAKIVPDEGILGHLEEQYRYNDTRRPYCIRIKEETNRGILYSCRFLLLAPVPNRHNTFTRIGYGQAPYNWHIRGLDHSMDSWNSLWKGLKKQTITLI